MSILHKNFLLGLFYQRSKKSMSEEEIKENKKFHDG